jgi:hypothetical protein
VAHKRKRIEKEIEALVGLAIAEEKRERALARKSEPFTSLFASGRMRQDLDRRSGRHDENFCLGRAHANHSGTCHVVVHNDGIDDVKETAVSARGVGFEWIRVMNCEDDPPTHSAPSPP